MIIIKKYFRGLEILEFMIIIKKYFRGLEI